ncbi:alpha-mannosidase [Ilumatobacter nonamiensis]|uniref:alpha-mannosidase n=1 Tax=Ilumatobacter nonamiensis TaxID=467093 RepID=UPI00058E7559|nr:glycoside hydrolase family 38 C-terminal domain-containing protein [Ilumatobacter nonamiensis]
MHDDRELAERRIDRELWERVLPLVHAGRVPFEVSAGPTPDATAPFEVGSMWGAPWETTWFELGGDVPAEWLGRRGVHRIEAVIDLGFTRDPAGFQAEGLVVRRRSDGSWQPLQGIHPRRTNYVLDHVAGSVELVVEAASNPTFPQFAPSRQGLPETASSDPIYRFRTADLVLVDVEAEALVHDLDVVDGVMRSLSTADPRRSKLRASIVAALDAVPDVAAARNALAPHLEPRATGGGRDRRHRIIATGHAHIDTAWLWPIRETIRKCTRTFASAVALMDDDPSYRFSCSQAQQYAWVEERHPDLFEKIREKVADGQWLPVGGMWVEADMNLPSGESLARQIVLGQRYFTEKFGAPCREVWIPDVFGYPAGLPQLFAAGGMDRFITQKLSWNKQNRFPHHTFWWEGLDGTRVLTHFPPVDTYNAEITPEEIDHSLTSFKEHSWSDVSLMPFGHGDGGGGPTREMLERAHRLADVNPDATLEIGGPDDYFAAVEREATHGAPVPVWRGELYFEMHRGTLTSQINTKLGNRRVERAFFAAELWEATTGERRDLSGMDIRPIADIWPDVLTQQFHDILPGSSIAWVHRDAELVFLRAGLDLSHHCGAHLGSMAPSSVSVANPAGVAFDGVHVFDAGYPSLDPDRWEEFGWLPDLPTPLPDLLARSPHQRLGASEFAVAFDVPAFGVAALSPRTVADRVVVTDCSMTNGQLAIRWNTQGDVTSIIDLASRRELIPSGESAAVLELGRDQPVEYDAWDLESWTREQSRPVGGGNVEVDVDGPLVGRVRVTREFGPSTVVTTYELRAESRQLDIDLHIDWHHDEHLLSMAFPLDVRADDAECDVQFGVTRRPTHPSSPWDAAKFEVCAHRYVSLSEPSFGVAVLNDGRFGHAIFDGAIRVSLARAAKYPDPDADHGEHRVRLAIRPHDGSLADVRAAAERFNRPLELLVHGTGNDVVQPDPTPIVSIVGHDGGPVLGVEVDAIKLADDDSGDLIVRLHEAVGDRTRITLSARTRIGSAFFCDLMETPERGEEVGDGVLTTTLRPFQLVTLRLRLAPDFDGRS